MTDDPIPAALARLVVGLDVLTAGQEALAVGQARLVGGQDTLRADVMERLDRLLDAMTEMRDDIAVNMTRAERARDAANGSRADARSLSEHMARSERAHDAVNSTRSEVQLLGEQVAAMYRQLKRLEARLREITGDP